MKGKNQFGIYNFNKIKEKIELNSDLKVLKSEYINQHSKINLVCSCGNTFNSTYRKLRENKFKTKCPICRNKNATISTINNNEKKFKKFMSNIKDYEIIEYKDVRENSKFFHKKCGKTFEMRTQTFKEGARCPCESSSRGERRIIHFLQENNIDYKKEYSFKDCRSEKNFPLRFDFAIFDEKTLKFLIEFNGIQHYKKDNWLNEKNGINDRFKNDNIKIEYCKKNNIPLLIIPYTQIDFIEKIIVNMLISSQTTKSHKSM